MLFFFITVARMGLSISCSVYLQNDNNKKDPCVTVNSLQQRTLRRLSEQTVDTVTERGVIVMAYGSILCPESVCSAVLEGIFVCVSVYELKQEF